MKNELRLLICELEEEYEFLLDEMNECINEWAFTEAEYYKNGISLLREKLRILNNLETSDYDRIQNLKSKIELMYRFEKPNQSFVAYKEKTIQALKDELSVLENQPPKKHIDSDNFLNCLYLMAEGKLFHFTLDINKVNWYFDFLLDNNTLHIKTGSTKNIDKNWLLSPEKISLFRRFGYEGTNFFFEKSIEAFNTAGVREVHEELSVIFFETFGLYGGKEGLITQIK